MFKFIEKSFIKTLHHSKGMGTKTDWGVIFMGDPDSIVTTRTVYDHTKWLLFPVWLKLSLQTQFIPQGVIAYFQYFVKIMGDFNAEASNYQAPPTVDFDKFEAMIRGRFHKAKNDADKSLEMAKIQPAEAKIVKEQIAYEQERFEASFSLPQNESIRHLINPFILQGYRVAWVQNNEPTVIVHIVRPLYDGVQHMDFAFLLDTTGKAHLQNTTDGYYPLAFVKKLVEEMNKRYDSVVVTK